VLHLLAQGGAIHFQRSVNGNVSDVACITPDGHVPTDCALAVFEKLKKRRFIPSYSMACLSWQENWA
jgi:Uncharacterized protein conserved in bacteria